MQKASKLKTFLSLSTHSGSSYFFGDFLRALHISKAGGKSFNAAKTLFNYSQLDFVGRNDFAVTLLFMSHHGKFLMLLNIHGKYFKSTKGKQSNFKWCMNEGNLLATFNHFVNLTWSFKKIL